MSIRSSVPWLASIVAVGTLLTCSPGNVRTGGGAGIPGLDAGAGGGVGNGGAGGACTSPGSTRSCCTTGTQTCSGGGEFSTWSACKGPGGEILTCNGAPAGCVPSEFTYCDGGFPPNPPLCKAGGVNNEPGILVGYQPAAGQSVGAAGQIKVWVNDEWAAKIAPGEVADPTTGAITTAGNLSAKAPDGYLWEPAVYVAPASAEDGGTPHFPAYVKGSYNNNPLVNSAGALVQGMDPAPSGSRLADKYTTEFIWNVSALGLGPGNYTVEFVIHDGDVDRGVGCVQVTIQ